MALITIGSRKINPSKVSYIEGKNVVSKHGSLICDDEDTLEEIKTAMEEGSSGFKGLCFTAVQANSTIKQNIGKDGCSYQTSTDGQTWEDYTLGTNITLENVGDKVYWNGNGMQNTTSNPVFVMTGKIAGSGSVMSMIDGVGESLDMTGNDFKNLFKNCESLIKSPTIPATILSSYCYQSMFYSCVNLITPPNLPATDLRNYCYYSMFYNCSSLSHTPTLPATTLANNCYNYMFYRCVSLESAELPAIELLTNCYKNMFNGCNNLYKIKTNAASWDESYAQYWLKDVANYGVFIKNSSTLIPIGVNGIPEGWEVMNN